MSQQEFQIVRITPGIENITRCRRKQLDLILLDISFSNSEGLDICKRLRACRDLGVTPIIFIFSPATQIDRILALQPGASDFIVRPFSLSELNARINLQLRTAVNSGFLLSAAGLELDQARCRVRLNNKELSLTATEFHLLEFLMAHPEEVFSREQLVAAVWANEPSVSKQIVDAYVLRLRKKLRTEAIGHEFIRAVRGFGYSFPSKRQVSEPPPNGVLTKIRSSH